MKKIIIFLLCFVTIVSLSCKKNVKTIVLMETNFGNITLELYNAKAPKTVENFLKYAENKHYDGTIFHRVISNFMIQGGGFTTGMVKKKTMDPIKNEANNGLFNNRGTIAMARSNSAHSATSQFFINVKDNQQLNYNNRNYGYCVFGKVIEGMDVVDKIKLVGVYDYSPTLKNVPVDDVIITSVRVVKIVKLD